MTSTAPPFPITEPRTADYGTNRDSKPSFSSAIVESVPRTHGVFGRQETADVSSKTSAVPTHAQADPLPRTLKFPINGNSALPAVTLYPLQEWEGFVTGIGKDSFDVRLLNITAGENYPNETAEISLEEISEADAARMGVGSIFRWVIGYRRDQYGTKQRVSVIVFRDLPAITESTLRRAKEWAREIQAIFSE